MKRLVFPGMEGIGRLVLRAGFGLFMMFHGAPRMFTWQWHPGASLGPPALQNGPQIMAFFVGLIEFSCGFFLLIGWLSSLSAFLILCCILVRSLPLLNAGFTNVVQTDVLAIFVAFYFTLAGSGRYSLDRLLIH